MAFHLTDRWGATHSEPSIEMMRQVLATLEIEDQEHPDVSLTHESGWCLSAFPSGLVIWENVEADGEPRHMTGLPQARVLELWQALAQGDLERIESKDWAAGYGSDGGPESLSAGLHRQGSCAAAADPCGAGNAR